jgi:hypothetical protein
VVHSHSYPIPELNVDLGLLLLRVRSATASAQGTTRRAPRVGVRCAALSAGGHGPHPQVAPLPNRAILVSVL